MAHIRPAAPDPIIITSVFMYFDSARDGHNLLEKFIVGVHRIGRDHTDPSSFIHRHAPLLALSMSASCCSCSANSSAPGCNTRHLGRAASVLNTAGLRVIGT